MRMIEPCCYNKQLEGLIDECASKHSSAHFFSYSDWDLCDLLTTLSGYCRGGEMSLAMVRLDAKLIAGIEKILMRTCIDPQNPSHHFAAVSKMILVSQPPVGSSAFDQRKEIQQVLGKYIQSGQLVVCEDNIGFRCVTVKNPSEKHQIVIQGSLNTQQSGAMQMFSITGSPAEYDNVAEMFRMKEHTKRILK